MSKNIFRLVKAHQKLQYYTIAPKLLPPDIENLHFINKTEDNIPKPVLEIEKFSKKKNLFIKFHRKPLTSGCTEAVRARSIALRKKLKPSQELKAVVLKDKNNIPITIFMPGNYQLPKNNKFINLTTVSETIGIKVKKTFSQVTMGRVNPITMHLNWQKGLLFYFIPKQIAKRPMYTNAGVNTWGICIPKIEKLMKAVGAKYIPNLAQKMHGIILLGFILTIFAYKK